MSKRIYVTGGNGRLARALFDRGIWAADTLVKVELKREGDFISFEDLLEASELEQADEIVHLAWLTVPSTAEKQPETIEKDFESLRRLLAAIGELEKKPRLIFSSTGAVYGNAKHGKGSLESDEFDTTGRAYANAKHEAEKMIQASGVPHVILRIANAYGAGGVNTAQGVIPVLVDKAYKGETFEQWGEDTVKDYLHMDDLASALRAVVDHGELNGVYNLASEDPKKLSEVIAAVKEATGRDFEVEEKHDAPWDVRDNRLCAKKMREATGWEPKVDFVKGIEKVAEEMRPQPESEDVAPAAS